MLWIVTNLMVAFGASTYFFVSDAMPKREEPMKSGLNKTIIVLGFVLVARVLLRSVPAMAHDGRSDQATINAALMFTGGENAICELGNISDAYVVTVSVADNPNLSEYISSSQGCVVLPITVATGTQINMTGVLQDTDAIPGGDPTGRLNAISEDCFNVEGFSVGLAAGTGSEFNPLDPANIINEQGYGFFWYDSDNDLKPGPFSYTVVGCSGEDCSTATSFYNTDGPSTGATCTVLPPFPPVSTMHKRIREEARNH